MAKVPFTFRFDEIYHAKLKVVADKQSRSMSNLIEYLCKLEVDKHEEKYGVIDLPEYD